MMTMTDPAHDKRICVLCDFDALYAAIELQLNRLRQVQVVRLEANPARPPADERPPERFDLIVVARLSPISNPLSILHRAALLRYVGQVPVLIVSEQPSRPAAEDKIIYLNFPFDLENLAEIAAGLLGQHLVSPAEHAQAGQPGG